MLNIKELKTIEPASNVLHFAAGTKPNHNGVSYVPLPLNVRDIFAKNEDGYWFLIPQPTICYDDNGIPYMVIPIPSDKPLILGVSTYEDKEQDKD